MPQVKIFGLRSELAPVREEFSATVHGCIVDVLHFPPEKRSHRFFPMDPEDFLMPEGKSARFTLIEISMFKGRSVATKKQLIRELFKRLGDSLGYDAHDLEITITETPRHNWGFRGLPGDELDLNYNVEV